MSQAIHTKQATETSPGIRILREILIVGIGYFVYSQVRGLAGDRVVDAFYNGYRVVQIEQDLGIFVERTLQALIVPKPLLLDIFNFIYVYGLFPLLLPTAAFLFWKRPRVYILVRNAFLLSGAIAVIFFLLLPTAPPRLMGYGLIDTLGGTLTPTYDSIPGVNHFAAVPSMHVGWNLLMAVALYMGLKGMRFRQLVLVFPLVMWTATLVTGNHYIVDGLLGMVVAMTALYIAWRIQLWGDNRQARKEQQLPEELEANLLAS
jgi:membrane-associated phospholipid phosphatase